MKCTRHVLTCHLRIHEFLIGCYVNVFVYYQVV